MQGCFGLPENCASLILASLSMTSSRADSAGRFGRDSWYTNAGIDSLDMGPSKRHALPRLTKRLMAEDEKEKRNTRRFALRLPVTVNQNGGGEQTAQTRDVSARGVCFYMDSSVAAGSQIEFTLTLPPEITLTESIRVRCKGKVVRVEDGDSSEKVAVAAVIDEYEFLSEK
jgi:hypothetical protein